MVLVARFLQSKSYLFSLDAGGSGYSISRKVLKRVKRSAQVNMDLNYCLVKLMCHFTMAQIRL